jgi:hypothetical protein
MKHTSIKQFHLAKLAVLKEEIKRDIRDNERRAKALRRAEEAEMTWEMVKLGVRPLSQRRLFK